MKAKPTKSCAIPSCEGRIDSFGLCGKHYKRYLRTGSFESIKETRQNEVAEAVKAFLKKSK